MLKLLRNPECKRTMILYCIVAGLVTAVAFYWELRFGFLMFGMCLFSGMVFSAATYKRYQKIASLATDINRILHGENDFTIAAYDEGELCILQSEIQKMTIRLREQREILKEDKIYLANALADISHQIRTPLTTINLLVSFLSDESITRERRKEVSRELYGLLSRIDWLITALLKISKLDAGTVEFYVEKIPFRELIDQAVAPILIPMELRNQSLVIKAEGDFSGDVAWTCEAITNIVKNCMEHTPEGGKIEISALENAIYREIIIYDNGSGISEQDLPHIFERFYKGQNSDEKSFGIGLALARMIVSAQNGTVKARNRRRREEEELPAEEHGTSQEQETIHGAEFCLRFYI